MNEKNLLELMNNLSIEEKVGQLIQITPDFFDSEGEVTGPAQAWNLDKRTLYQVGSVLGTHTREQVEMIQKIICNVVNIKYRYFLWQTSSMDMSIFFPFL